MRTSVSLLLRLTVFWLSVLLAGTVLAQEQWQAVSVGNDVGEVSTWVRSVEGAQVKAFRGEVELAHSALVVLAVLDDIDQCHRWVFQCQGAQPLAQGGAHLRFNGIWPVDDRDATIISQASVKSDSVLVRTVVQDGVLAEQKGYVRIPELNNFFEIFPLPNGHTKVVFQTFVDPGGMLPAWVSNLVAKYGPLVTLVGLGKMAQEKSATKLSVADLSDLYGSVRKPLAALLSRQAALQP